MPADTGQRDLSALLASLQPELLPDEYVFCSLPGESLAMIERLDPIAVMREREGLSLVIRAAVAAEHDVAGSARMRCLSLRVHSDLEAVGLTAAIASTLAGAGISANVIAGYFHDHVFVPAGREEEALQVLQALSRAAHHEV